MKMHHTNEILLTKATQGWRVSYLYRQSCDQLQLEELASDDQARQKKKKALLDENLQRNFIPWPLDWEDRRWIQYRPADRKIIP